MLIWLILGNISHEKPVCCANTALVFGRVCVGLFVEHS